MAIKKIAVGAYGADVASLHEFLRQEGMNLPSAEVDRAFYGNLTRQAVQQYQRNSGLPVTGVVDENTASAINAAIAASNIRKAPATALPRPTLTPAVQGTALVPSSGQPVVAPSQQSTQDENRGLVQGKLVDQDGTPVAATRVSIFAEQIRGEEQLGSAQTDAQGQYAVSYERPSALNIVARAFDASGKVLAQSAVVYGAAAKVQIDFTTAADGIVRTPSTFTNLLAKVQVQLNGVPLEDLKENKDSHEIAFLANAVGAQFNNVANLFISRVLALQNKLRDETLFGIFQEGIPASLNAALADLPDAGIDSAFISQVLSGVLSHSRATLDQTLTAAVNANIIPASYADSQDAELTLLDGLRVQRIQTGSYVRGKTSINDLLNAGAVTSAVQSAFSQAYANASGDLKTTWQTLRANTNLPATDLVTLQTTLQLSELLVGNLVLLKDTLARLSQKTLASVQNLALLDQNDWIARITALDPQATSIPPVLPNETPEQRIARLAKALTNDFSVTYPTTAFLGALSKATDSSFKTKPALIQFLGTNPTFTFTQTNIDQYLSTKKISVSQETLKELKTAQRLFRIIPQHSAVDALNSAGFQSAQSIYFKGRAPFISQMSGALGGASQAQTIYAKAQMTYATALMAFGRYNQTLNGIQVAAIQSSTPDPGTLANLPDLQALFGSLDCFQCEDCQSVYSPAAYLVDLLQYLAQFSTNLNNVSGRDALLQRRPDIQYIALNCNNTNTTLPYIDVVNEILEAVIAPGSSPVTFIDTLGTSAERRALPQQISQAAYNRVANPHFPEMAFPMPFLLTLPFDLSFAQTSAYCAALNTTWSALISLFVFRPTEAGASDPTIACASLGINPEMQSVISTADSEHPWLRWGLLPQFLSVIDPTTGNPYSPTPLGWIGALNKVPVLLNRSGLSLQQLYQLLEVVWVTQSSVTLQLGTTTLAGVQILSPNPDDMIFTGLTGPVLDRANRFIRLWQASKLQMWELDWALEHVTGELPTLDQFFVYLAGAIAVSSRLRLPFQEVLSFWMPLETRDVTSHLGPEDSVIPSTYSEVFRNPAVLNSWAIVFVPLLPISITAASNTSPITITTAQPHGYVSGAPVSISGVGGNTAANGTFTITVTGANMFTLASSTGNGAYTSGGAAVVSLSGNPILTSSSVSPTPEQNAITAALALSANDIAAILAFTGASNALSLDTLNTLLSYQRLAASLSLDISDLILWIQLCAATPFGAEIPVIAATNASPISITTSVPHGLQTNAQVSIAGVSGNAAANGTFTITVTGPTTFTLKGATGSGNWTGGGAVAVNAPSDTLEFLRRLAVLSATGIALHDLDYLLRNQSVSQSSIAFTAVQATAALQAIRDAIASLPIPAPLQVTGASYASPIAITTATAHGLETGAQVSITGVGGNTNANGTFTITIVNATSFTLDGSAGNGAWTSGGIVTPSYQVTGASNASPIAITTATAHGLETGAQVSITGVGGNTNANGTFTITTVNATSFTLNGSAGNGAWTSGGIVTPTYYPSTIQTIFLSALATATSVSSDAISPVLLHLGILPLDPTTIAALIAQTSGVDPTAFPTLINGITAVAKAAALFTASKPTTAEFSFVVQNAGVFGWLDPSALPLTSVSQSPYPEFEALIGALKLNRLQTARTPKLFDVLGQWLVTIPANPTIAISGNQFAIVGASNATPIAITTATAHGLQSGSQVAIYGVGGNTAANGAFTITVTGPSSFTLNGSTGNGAWTSGGSVTAVTGNPLTVSAASNTSPIAITTTSPHGLQTGMQVVLYGVAGNTAANGLFTVTVTGSSTFTLNGSIGNGALTSAGSVIAVISSLALALNANVADVTAIATALNATAPTLNAANQSGSLADIAMLTSISNTLQVCARYGISGAMLVQLAQTPADANSASAARTVLQAQYSQDKWFAAIQPVEDKLRETRRDALVAYLLGSWAARDLPRVVDVVKTPDDIFDLYLIDPEMSSCAVTTRLLEASLAIQQFVEQCFLNLPGAVTVDMSNTQLTDEWSWRQQYRLWQANREVFLYPENYLLPELRTNASSFFSDLMNDLRQSDCNANAAESAMENYLRKLVGISRLVVAAHYNQKNSDGSTILYVFAHTQGTSPQWYYRTQSGGAGNPTSGVWSAWQSLNLDIGSCPVIPVIWDSHLHLVWPIFKQISAKQGDQPVPSSGGGSSPAPQKFWTVEFAMSEFCAGQWQPKRSFNEKMFFATPDSPLSFTFQAFQDSIFRLQISVYFDAVEEAISQAFENLIQLAQQNPLSGGWHTVTAQAISATATVKGNFIYGAVLNPTLVSTTSTPGMVGAGLLLMPEAPLSATEVQAVLPPAYSMDLSQEPTYSLVNTAQFNAQLATPSQYGYSGQDLVFGNYTSTNAGTQVLYVLCATAANTLPISIELLGTITNPRIVIPQQEGIFDSAGPFFIADPNRTYLVLPQYSTISSSPKPLPGFPSYGQWSTSYVFQTFYHPFARVFLRELEINGVSGLMARALQLNPQAVRKWPANLNFDFFSMYDPQPCVEQPYPGTPNAPDPGETNLDFDPACGGAYSLYNWEIFYHVPMFIASLLLQNQKFQYAMTWLEYIFDPMDSSNGQTPQRFWEFAPFNLMNSTDWTDQQIQNLLSTLAADTQQGISDPATVNAITAWSSDPFDPHAVASLRIAAYGKATVMKFLDNLIAWGDSLFSQYTAETVNQAEQLYIIADMILGPKPQLLRPPSTDTATPITYSSLQNIDAFSNTLVQVENIIVAPEAPMALVQGTAQTPSLPQFPGNGSTLLFCIPPNDQLLAYWDTVAQRLYNIRHCRNIQGVPVPLPLYAPPINPLLLAEAQAAGAGALGAAAPAPVYRFSTYLQKAVELANDVRSFGALVLAALEKQDSEALAALRATQEVDIQTRMLDVKQGQVTEAQDQVTALQNQKAVVQIRYNFYSNIAFMNAWEIAAIALQGAALISNACGVIFDIVSGVAHVVPSIEFGAVGFGGTPALTVKYGGENVGRAASSWASVARGLGAILSESGGIAATMGGYQRRMDEWQLQAQLAGAELTQLDSQVTAATDRLNIANKEFDIQNVQITNAQAVSDFLTTKYTNAQLYNWMASQLTTVYAQAYQLAFSLALQANNAYQYELGSLDTFIQNTYWDSPHKGLTAGESLLFALRRMEAQYVAENTRELELTKHISLALTNPLALVLLRETGNCIISLDEVLFDRDQPGQYFRRLRCVEITIPCVVGPYTGVNATLVLTKAVIRTQPPSGPYTPMSAANDAPSVISSPGTTMIATSNAQNDAGLFEVNLRDERWLPFEGQGAISQWSLTLDPRDNNFDFSTITDVILHVRYTARGGIDPDSIAAVRTGITPQQGSILVSVKNTFSDSYYKFFNPADTTATQQTLTLPITPAVFPFSNLGNGIPNINDLSVFVFLEAPVTDTLPATIGPASGTPAPTALSLVPYTTTQTTSGASVAALLTPPPPIANSALGGATPQSLNIVVPSATIPASLATTVNGQTRLDSSKVVDVVLIIDYQYSG